MALQYQRLEFTGNIRRWMDEILCGNDNLLLCSPGCESPSEHVGLVDANGKRKIGLFSSGSMGRAKCIWNTLDRLQLNARISAREFQISSGDRLLMMAKPWHVAGLSWMLMAELLNLEYQFVITRKGEEEEWLEAIKKFRPDCVLTVPQVLRSLSNEEWRVPKIIYGGAPVLKEDYSRFAKHGRVLVQGYGQTEAGGLISCYHVDLKEEQSGRKQECYGQWPEEFEIRCNGRPRQPAPIWLKSPTAYRNGFYDTGDDGYISDGRLFLAGRRNMGE